jgi:polyferredoxin
MATSTRTTQPPKAARGGCGPVRPSRNGKWRALSLVLVHVVMVAHFMHWWWGGTTLSPVEPSEAMDTLRHGWLNAGFILFAVTILTTLVLGRWFCGWLCHVVALQDGCAWLLKKAGLRPRPVRSRLLVWIPLGAALYMFAYPPLQRVLAGLGQPELQNHLLTDDYWATFPGPVVGALTFLVCGGILVWWMGAKGFCTYGCPYGAVFGAVDRLAPARILVTDACEGCGHCTAVCTSNVRVHEEVAKFRAVVDPGCMKCLDCVSVCPKGALYFGFGKPKAAGRSRRVYDFSWGEEVVLAVGFVAGFLTFRGLYHLVPFLFSLGLGVMTAVALSTLVRLCTRADVALQHWRLRAAGRVTRAGRVAWVVGSAWLLFTAHSAYVHWRADAGEELFHEGARQQEPAQRASLLARAEPHLRAADGVGLFVNAEVEYCLGQLARERKDYPEAERRLRRAVEAAPRHRDGLMGLATVILHQRPSDLDAAERCLRQILRYHPDDAAARRLIEARYPPGR